jgi:hypothetical protein
MLMLCVSACGESKVLTSCSRLVNIAVGVFMVLGGISNFFPATWSSVILGVYVIIFGLGMLCSTYIPGSG